MNAPEPERSVCSSCGAEIEEGSLTCFHCGFARRGAPLTKGQMIADRYELTNLLGRGGMGTVYDAHDRSLDERVALKVLSESARGSGDAERRFRDEIKLARKIRHPNVCGIHEYGKFGEIQYIVMEFIDGQDLKKYLRERGALTTAEALDLASQIGEGLQAIHDAGVIHRDLKLANVMRDKTGRLRLMDFGIAKFMGDTTATATGQIIGTPEYMSPEQVQGLRLDPRSDLYSLAVMTYELLTGRVPFRADTPLATIMLQVHQPPQLDSPSIPAALVPILTKALAKDPESRYPSVRAFVTALASVPRSGQTAPSAQPELKPSPPLTMEMPTPRPASLQRTGSRPAVARNVPAEEKPEAPKTNMSSETRWALWLSGALGLLFASGIAVWLALPSGEDQSEPDPRPPAPAPARTLGVSVAAARPDETQVPTAPSPVTSAPSPVRPLAVKPLDMTPEVSPSRTAAATPTVAMRPNGVAPPTGDPAPAVPRPSRPVDVLAAPANPPVSPATSASRTPLPAARLRPLPDPASPAPATLAPASTPAPSMPRAEAPPRGPAVGRLQLGARPFARVLVDGQEVGTLPFAPIELAEGKHVVRFIHPDYQPLQRTVTIKKGESMKLFVDFSLDGIAK